MLPGLPYKLEFFLESKSGIYLRDHQGTEVQLPLNEKPEDLQIGDKLLVYVYKDANNQLIGTTQKPLILLNETALLEVKSVTKFGAFVHWGPEKDLFVPFKEQLTPMETGKKYLVYMYLDTESNRLAGTGYIYKQYNNNRVTVKEKEEVDLLIAYPSDLGQNVIINNKHLGLIYANELYRKVNPGDKVKGYIYKIRDKHKIDVRLQKSGAASITDNADKILKALEKAGGYLPLNDNSSPEEIYKELGMSKKLFKKGVGTLYKKRIITLEPKGIRIK
jgi:predicted RNA-binding protein (virulence factor B family)